MSLKHFLGSSILLVTTALIACATPDTRVPPGAAASGLPLDGQWEGKLTTKGRHVRGTPVEIEFSVCLPRPQCRDLCNGLRREWWLGRDLGFRGNATLR
jgi:hypothetical protein